MAEHDEDVLIHVQAEPSATPLRVTINGLPASIPYNIDTPVSRDVIAALDATDVVYRVVTAAAPVAAEAGAGAGAAAGGTGGSGVSISPEIAEIRALSVEKLKAKLAELTAEQLVALRAAEVAEGEARMRVTAIAAIDDALADRPQS